MIRGLARLPIKVTVPLLTLGLGEAVVVVPHDMGKEQ